MTNGLVDEASLEGQVHVHWMPRAWNCEAEASFTAHNYTTVGMCGINFFISVWFMKKKYFNSCSERVWFGLV